MLKNMFIIAALLLATNVALANPVSENPNLDVTSLNKILQIEDGFVVISTDWSPDGQHLLVTCSKSDSPSNRVVKHYLLDMNSHTFGDIDYGINGSGTNGILEAKWTPSGDKIYFGVSRIEETNSGYCYIICNPDGTNLKCIGTNYTDLSYIIKNLGSIGFQRNLNWNLDYSKIVFEWQKPGNDSTGVYIAKGDGTNTRQLPSLASGRNPEPIWRNSDEIFTITDEGTVVLANDNGDLIQTFQPENKDEIYWAFSLSPDRKKIMFVSGLPPSGLPGSYNLQTYVSNIDGSNLKGNLSYVEDFWANESWQPNGSLLLINQNGNLYIVGGDKNDKRLLYEGDASEPQWFSNGKKILFVENKNKLYSINVDGTNLTFITNFGRTYPYFWNSFEEAKRFSISPPGEIIAFTSTLYPDTGKIIENEPASSARQKIAAPLFIVNSDGSDLTQVTPAIKGRHEIFGKWSPDGTKFTIDSVIFSENRERDSSLVELNALNSSYTWKNMPVKKILGSEGAVIDKVQINEPDFTNTSQATENKETSNQSPSFMFLQLFVCIMGVWLLHKAREQ
jgi:Periplasmic component of the Tol biopolymer transport system